MPPFFSTVVSHASKLKDAMKDVKHSNEAVSYLKNAIIYEDDAMHEIEPGRVPIGLNVALVTLRANMSVRVDDFGRIEVDSIDLEKDFTVQVPSTLLALRPRHVLRSEVDARVDVKKLKRFFWEDDEWFMETFGGAIQKHIVKAAATNTILGRSVTVSEDGEHKVAYFCMPEQSFQMVITLPHDGLETNTEEAELLLKFIRYACERRLTPKWFERDDLVAL